MNRSIASFISCFRRFSGHIVLCLINTGHAQEADSLRPNLCPRVCDMETYGHEYFADSVRFWFDNAVANIGDYKLEVKSGAPFGPHPGWPWEDDDSAFAIQKWKIEEFSPIFDGPAVSTFVYDTVGVFVYHSEPSHAHWHYEGFAQYALLEVVGSSGVGDTVVVSPKTGFCLIDADTAHNPESCGCGPIEGVEAGAHYNQQTCYVPPPGLIQGISVGRFDRYQWGTAGQSMTVTNVPNGVYWLESRVDPNDSLVESSNADNVKKIKVQVISTKDSYEVNDSKEAVDAMPLKPAGQGSANLAACGFPIVIPGLSIHGEIEGDYHEQFDPDEDWFRFLLTSSGDSSNYIRIEFDQELGDLELELYNSAGGLVATSQLDENDREEISLNQYSAGWYYARVIPDDKLAVRVSNMPPYFHIHYNYLLEINAPPGVCGDYSGNGVVNTADLTALGQYCNQGTPPACFGLGDVDGTCGINCGPGGDLAYLTAYLFSGGPPPNCNCQP